MRRYRPSRRRAEQQGSVAFLVLAIMTAMMGMTIAAAAALVHIRSAGDNQSRLAYLDRARRGISDWYLANASVIDAGADSLSSSQILSAMGVPAQFGVQVASTQMLGLPCSESNSPSCVGYHDIYVWLPPISTADTTTLDASSGTFNADSGAQWVKISGEAIEQQLIGSSTDTMTLLQTQLRAFFAASERSDADVNPETNFFRDTACSTTFDGSLPCVDTFADISTTAIPGDLGIDTTNESNAWGLPIQVTNQEYSSVSQPPYSMAIRSATPWGSYLQMAVVEPN